MSTRERPILFSGPMVRAILDGRKTVTRRVVKHVPPEGTPVHLCPYGSPGDRLWVRETWFNSRGDDSMPTHYRADDRIEDLQIKWKPSIFMPRWASRITLVLKSVRVERLQDITEEDAKQEGCEPTNLSDAYAKCEYLLARNRFREVWTKINGPASWDANPWVWRLEFEKEDR